MTKLSVGELFADASFTRCEPSILQPADVFLDRSGDAIRRRLFTVRDASGVEHCLRPEFTIPVCRDLIAANRAQARVWYEGPIFRLAQDGGATTNETLQAGIEVVGGSDAVADDAQVFALINAACGAGGGHGGLSYQFGDLGLFDAVLLAVDLPQSWRDRLRKNYWHADVFAEILKRIGGAKPEVGGEAGQLLNFVQHLDRAAAEKAVTDMLASSGIKPIGGRSVEEITERFLQKAEDLSSDIAAPDVVAAIESYLVLNAPMERAADLIAAHASEHRLSIDAALRIFAARTERLLTTHDDLRHARFAASFGREIEYYTGFVFEIHSGGTKLAGGGRYDGLMRALGARQATPAVGAAVWPGRVVETAGAER